MPSTFLIEVWRLPRPIPPPRIISLSALLSGRVCFAAYTPKELLKRTNIYFPPVLQGSCASSLFAQRPRLRRRASTGVCPRMTTAKRCLHLSQHLTAFLLGRV